MAFPGFPLSPPWMVGLDLEGNEPTSIVRLDHAQKVGGVLGTEGSDPLLPPKMPVVIGLKERRRGSRLKEWEEEGRVRPPKSGSVRGWAAG